MSILKWIIRLVIVFILLFASYFAGIIICGSICEYKPLPVEGIAVTNKSAQTPDSIQSFCILTWNLGYFGLGAEMDFFYDGGQKVKTPGFLISKYSKGITDFLKSNDSIDFMLFQEADVKASRSAKLNEITCIERSLPEYSFSYAPNYQSFFVPVPIFDPMGTVSSGLLIFSRYSPQMAQRYAYNSSYSWPKKLFMPDRCFLVSRFSIGDEKELIIINTHNSAFDVGGKLREIEMSQIRDFMISEFSKGNFVVAGGDWNQNPPELNVDGFSDGFIGHKVYPMKKTFFPEGWQFVYSPLHPTNRNLDVSWNIEKTATTIIDFFILSPNIKVEMFKTFDLGFQYSDHEPVLLKFSLSR